MKNILVSFAMALCAMSTQAQDTLWAHAADRFGLADAGNRPNEDEAAQ